MSNTIQHKFLRIKDLQMRIAINADEKAFNELYVLLYNDIVSYVYKLLKSYEYAEEVVSDVFMKLWKIKDQIVDIQNLKVYLYKASKNYSLNYISNKHKVALKAEILPNFETYGSPANPEEICISNESVMVINKAIQKLPAQCRCIFRLIKEEGLQYKEVASALNISAFTVRNQMNIATKKINRSFLAYGSREAL